MAYALSQRKKEIGIRVALGATSRAVVALLMQQSGRLAAIGLVIAAAAFATYVPARKASRIDPAETLRADG